MMYAATMSARTTWRTRVGRRGVAARSGVCMRLAFALKQFRNWCRPKREAFSWFSLKENHTSRFLRCHSNCELLLKRDALLHSLYFGGRHSGDRCDVVPGFEVAILLS